MPDCIFCKIIKKEIPSHKIYEDKNCYAFLDINPINFGHALVIPKKHYETFEKTPAEELKKIIEVINKIAPKITQAVNADGFNVGVNNGESAGQIIFHTHFHIIPRFKNDNLGSWPGKKVSESELINIKEKILKTI